MNVALLTELRRADAEDLVSANLGLERFIGRSNAEFVPPTVEMPA